MSLRSERPEASFLERGISRKDFLGLGVNSALLAALSRTGQLKALELEAVSQQPMVEVDFKPLVGAIRWGGWFNGSKWAKNLEDPRWHSRLPFYSKIGLDGKSVEVLGDRQEVMDQEIDYAKQARIDFWAYCLYDKRTPFNIYNYGLKHHLASKVTDGPKISLILQGAHFGGEQGWDGFADNLVQTFTQEKYQLLPDKRPLLFILEAATFNDMFKYYDRSRKALDQLREKTIKANLNNPFLVGLNVEGELVHLGFDALGAYTANGSGVFREYPYSALMAANLEYWIKTSSNGAKFVPTVNVGWDPRPRLHMPDFGSDYHGPWYTMPTKEEISFHAKMAIKWLKDHPNQSVYNMLLFYAWNEFDEGGILVPTLFEGTSRIDTLSEVFTGKIT